MNENDKNTFNAAPTRLKPAGSNCSPSSTPGHAPAASRASSRMQNVARRASPLPNSRRCANVCVIRDVLAQECQAVREQTPG